MKKILLAFVFVCICSAPAFSFEKPGFYSVNADGWTHNVVPRGDVFTCAACKEQFQISIGYGPEFPDSSPLNTNAKFIRQFSSDSYRKKFAESIMSDAVPMGFRITVNRTGLSKLGGLDVFQFNATVDMNESITHDNRLIAVHRKRMMVVTLNYFDGAMTPKNEELIKNFFRSLKFYGD